ncbi:outer membrane beta-barrel protein [Helicobacter cetorum]|uniref:Outer membrane protein n=1 Tax=Helicobacter cetorum (strain ATCC BAA-540 / CCUG 52418 / MIT 99-5656) TaxID=1163745 RepID=I0EQQ6_HELCM|nr:outer membrane beta-barrel protein [Helicobacter cetorum]AFI05275.1 hypothetical protein HCD_01215 [Helicobacter cetorum MIT 99-5656]
MKKICLILCLLFSLLGAFESKRSHLFLGAMVGLAPIQTQQKTFNTDYTAFLWGVKGGYQFAFLKFLALRTDFSYLMVLKPTALNTIVTSLLSVNVDVLSNFYTYKKFSLGVYGGLGIGNFYQNIRLGIENSLFMGYNGLFNVGVGSTIANHHRIEFGAKIPFSKIRNSFEHSSFLNGIFVQASYSYLF